MYILYGIYKFKLYFVLCSIYVFFGYFIIELYICIFYHFLVLFFFLTFLCIFFLFCLLSLIVDFLTFLLRIFLLYVFFFACFVSWYFFSFPPMNGTFGILFIMILYDIFSILNLCCYNYLLLPLSAKQSPLKHWQTHFKLCTQFC